MFYRDGILYRSACFTVPDLFHGFSTRAGGVSTLPHTAAMNVAFLRGDGEAAVRQNLCLLAAAASGLPPTEDWLRRIVCGPQIHSARVRTVGAENGGEGILREGPEACDGYATDTPGIALLIRVADCVPILLRGRKPDGTSAVAAVHAGWRGTAAGIAREGVRALAALGAAPETVYAAVGPCIHPCCYQVGEDLRDAVAAARGADFAARHIRAREGQLYADLPGMNRELLLASGVPSSHIDVSPACTRCRPEEFHSHRATGGRRGAMGALVGIREM